MAQQIIWSDWALEDRRSILAYFVSRNRSNTYSLKLDDTFIKTVEMLAKEPLIGKSPDDNDIYYFIVGNYKIIYRITKNHIRILRIWDTRQDHEKLKY